MEPKRPVPKLFVIVRADIPHGYQLSQAIHGRDEFHAEHTEVSQRWRQESNTVVVLHAEGVEHLRILQIRARARGIPCSMFHEPDLGNDPTCLVLGPSGRRLTSDLPLAA